MHAEVIEFEKKLMKSDIPDFRAGDTVRVSVRIVEGDKERIQDFEGVCIARKGSGAKETFTVRRVSLGVGMERVFPMHSPRIEKIQVVRHGKVRRAKLYYLRELRGKKARITEVRRDAAKINGEAEMEEPEMNTPETESAAEAVEPTSSES